MLLWPKEVFLLCFFPLSFCFATFFDVFILLLALPLFSLGLLSRSYLKIKMCPFQ